MRCSQPNLVLKFWAGGGGEGGSIFFYFLQMLLATNSMNFTSKQKGYKCKNFNANSAYSLSLNTIQHSWSPSTLQIPATFLLRHSDSEVTLLSCTGNIHFHVELQLLGKRKGCSRTTTSCTPRPLAHMQTKTQDTGAQSTLAELWHPSTAEVKNLH